MPLKHDIYPTEESLDTVLARARASLPITDPNTLLVLLMTYHNTLIAQLIREGELHERH